jgi:hypothetical protein
MESKVLESRKIKVEPVIRKRAFFPKGHDGEHTYTGCHKDYCLPFDAKKRAFLNPFIKEEEQEEFEKLLDQPEGALNLYKRNSKFWGDFSISLTKEGLTLDLNNPVDALWYRVFNVSPRFASTESQKSNPKCDFILIDEKVKEEYKSELSRKKEKALDEFMKLKKSRTKLYDTLRLLNKKPDKDASIDALKDKLLEVIDEPSSNRGVTNIGDFLKVIEDPTNNLKLFILDAIDIGEIIYNSKEGYKIKDTGQNIGKYIEQAVVFFNTKDADVLNTKAIIETRLK